MPVCPEEVSGLLSPLSDLTPAALMSGLFGLNRCAPLGEFSLLLLLLLLLDGVLSPNPKLKAPPPELAPVFLGAFIEPSGLYMLLQVRFLLPVQ